MEILNYIFVFCIIVSFVAYFYYKANQFRATLPIRKKWYRAKANTALGIVILCTGCNIPIIYPTGVGMTIAIIFFALGFLHTKKHWKISIHEGKYVQEEYELNQL